MTQAATFAQDLTSAAFVVLALLTGLQWYRHRSRAQGMLTLALVFLGLVAIAGRVPQSPVLGALEIVAFMLSGWFVLLFRHEFIPLSTRAFRVALGLLAISIAAGLAAVTVLSGAGQAVITVVALILVGSWAVFVGEPIVRFWAASRGVPAVQRARMRSLSFGFAVLIAILVVDVIGGPALRSPLAIVITQLIALVTVPVIYVSLAPPLTLRRIWQMGEEDALRSATQDLLIFSPDRKTLAERACGWATRLMGAQGAFLVDEDGTVLATTGGMDSALVDRVVASRPGIAGGEGSQFIT
ncbi:MAG TPA: hypothetical protein VHQ03_02100, partial [Candidatus Dormibacteraeota bacterium]|nr:hypothetical protein [Candidatus Dormibacteraeota bacterium]